MKYLAAAVQMTSTGDTTGNLERAVGLIKEAASRGATLIGLPENWSMIRDESDEPPAPISFDEGPMGALRALCREKSVTLIAGTVPEAGPDGKVFNSCPVIGPDGEIISVYRKIHLFDVVIRGGEAHRESRHVAPGKDAVIADTSCGKIGLSVCYDLRFPELYRTLARRGARVLSVPAAFTLHTGKDHWVVLIKARA
ncbi:MAG TPA: nitrilase-related carbon-nitrogen hydrolase, partial [bacterium]|nr:nitrilase-related carbon-nitrogen hydrolase [bacterium]